MKLKLLGSVALALSLMTGLAFAQGSSSRSTASPSGSSATSSTMTGSSQATGTTGQAMTQSEAKQKIEQEGYTDVTNLQKGQNGWTGEAKKNGKTEQIQLTPSGQVEPVQK